MLETPATVIRLEGGEAIVEAAQSGGCGSCSGGKGCGSGKLSQMLCVRPREFRVRNDAEAQVGDRVLVGVADGLLLRSALILYGLPMLLLFCGAFVGAHWPGGASGRDAAAAFGGAAGLAAGFLLARFITGRQGAAPLAIIRCDSTPKSAIL